MFLALFVWRQLGARTQRRGNPLLDLRVFRSRSTLAVIIMSGSGDVDVRDSDVAPANTGGRRRVTALESGLVLLPGSILMGVLAPLMGGST